ncbi:S24 family peptidase [Blautia schinkii]|nr:S24 family peptidase [Blautia schinkii]
MIGVPQSTFSSWEIYRFISQNSRSGKETVDYILNHKYNEAVELEKCFDKLKDKSERIAELETAVKRTSATIRLYTYMHKIAAAGTGFYFDDIPTDTIAAPYVENTDFLIGVSGTSMEPTYHDGDLVYVEKRQIGETGDVGVFMVNDECYIKEAGEEGLISHDAKYPVIPGDEHILCIGKVLGKVQANQ